MIVTPVIELHAHDAAFLWLLRDSAVSQPHYSLGDLAKLDARIDAHLDGLRIAGEDGWKIAREALVNGEPGEVFVAAVLSFGGRGDAPTQVVLDSGNGDLLLSRALVSGLGWLRFEQARAQIHVLLADPVSFRRRIGLGAAVVHRADPGRPLAAATLDEYLPLRARALRAIGELGRRELLGLVEQHLTAEDSEVRFSAGWSATILSSTAESLSTLSGIAQSGSRHSEQALQTVMRRSELRAARAWNRDLARDTATERLAVQGAGAIGDPAEMPWLIDQMKVSKLARVAGESFSTMTGVDIAYLDLAGKQPDGFESGPTEDPADENVEMDPDENLPWPDPDLIQKWWQSHRHAFQPGTRYLLGKPITLEWCKQVLRIGRQRQRAAAALELAMRQPGTPLFEVRAPGFRQKQLLGV